MTFFSPILRAARSLSGAALVLAFAAASMEGAAVAAPAPLSESLTGEAKSAYDTGIRFFKEGDFKGARLKFEQAHALSKDPRLLWNMAACERSMHHYARALDLLDRYMIEGKDAVTKDDQNRVDAFRQEIAPLVARFSVTSDPPGASVFVDGLAVGSTPMTEPARIDVGEHELRLELAGFETLTRKEDVAAGTQSKSYALTALSNDGILIVSGEPKDAIQVDGLSHGAGRWQGSLHAGEHRVRVSAPRMVAQERTVKIERAKTTTATFALVRQPPPVPIWAWVVGSAVLTGGTAVGAYFLFRPRDSEPVPTTLDSITITYAGTWP